MKIIQGKPSFYDRAVKELGANEQTIFTVGDTIYTQGSTLLDLDLIAHETVHSVAQGDNPDAWWERYFKDKDFRKQQEVAAYRVQYLTYCNCKKDRNQRARFAFVLASTLAGKLYGNLCDFQEAYIAITTGH